MSETLTADQIFKTFYSLLLIFREPLHVHCV